MSFATVGPIHGKPITHCAANACCPLARGLDCLGDSCLIVSPPFLLLLFTNFTLICLNDSRHTRRIHMPSGTPVPASPPDGVSPSDKRRGQPGGEGQRPPHAPAVGPRTRHMPTPLLCTVFGGLKLRLGRFRLDIRKYFLLKERSGTGTGCPGQWWSPHPWRGSRTVWMWHLGTGLPAVGDPASAGGLD